MAVLATGSGLARLIGIASIPVITRLYSPDDFAVLAIFAAIVSLLAPIVTLRYVLAIPLPRRDDVAINLVALSLALMACFTVLLSVLLAITAPTVLSAFSADSMLPWWWLIIIGVVASATYELLTLWATRERNYKVIAATNVWQSAAGATVKICLGLLNIKPLGLLIGQIVATGGGITVLWRNFAKSFAKSWKGVRHSTIRKLAWHYRGFAQYRVPSQFLLVFSSKAPILLVALLFDADTTGQLALAFMAVALPVTLLGRTTAKAFYAEASKIGRKQSEAIRIMLIGVLKRLGLFALTPALALLLFGPELFRLIFGDSWNLAGVFAASLATFMFFQFLQTPAAHVFYIFDGQRALLFLNIQRTLLIAATFGLAYVLEWPAVTAIWCYSVVLSLHYALTILYALRFIPKGVEGE